MDQNNQLSLAISERDKALRRVASRSGEWIKRALRMLPEIRYKSALSTVTGEDVRVWLEQRMEPPHHHNAYGALIRMAIQKNVLRPTGKFVQMRTKKSHARMTQVYWVR